MPLTTICGRSDSSVVPRKTQSAGVPEHAYEWTFAYLRRSRVIASSEVIAWETPLRSPDGATTITECSADRTSTSASMPGESIPSSFVMRMRVSELL
jgi:hypothetical protein